MRRLLALTLLIVVGAAGGCSSDGDSTRDPGLTVSPLAVQSTSQSAYIGPAGGVVDAGGVQVIIPAGAMAAASVFTLEWDGASQCTVSPSGPPLLDDAILRMQKPPGASIGAVYHIFGYDEDAGVWVDLGGVEIQGKVQIGSRFVNFSSFDLDELD